MLRTVFATATAMAASSLFAQTPNDPFPDPINSEDAIVVDFVDFATLPVIGGVPARMMELEYVAGTDRYFVSDMRGPIYTISPDGGVVTEYIDINDERWDVNVQFEGRETGMQNFAFHPQFSVEGTPGYGKFYTWTDSSSNAPVDYAPNGDGDAHDTVLHEWTTSNPDSGTYDGGLPRELLRIQQPFGNHNGGELAFNPLLMPGDPDFGLLFVSIADGGAGGDPYNMAQDLSSAFGKIFRIDPLGSNSDNGEYGVPEENPFTEDGNDETLAEIYAYGVRNGQHIAWDPANGNMFLADIGQNTVEKVTLVTPGANLGWNDWEGSFRFSGGAIDISSPRSDSEVTYPVVEWARNDPLVPPRSAASGLLVQRNGAIPALEGRLLFGDLTSGEIFSIDADALPDGGQDAIARVLLNDDGEAKPLLQIVQETNREQGQAVAQRVDVRIDGGPDGEIFLLNKGDGVIRMLTP